jgi:hypothetical protein
MRVTLSTLVLCLSFAGGCAGDASPDPSGGTAGNLANDQPPGLYQESPAPNEDQLFDSFAVQIQQIQDRMAESAPLSRGFHVKQHLCTLGTVRVFEDDEILQHAAERGVEPRLDDVRVGVFAAPATYDAWVRLSNGTIMSKPDGDPDVRGLAVKMMGVDGDRLIDDGGHTQDILMTNKPFNLAKDSPGFMEFARATAGFELEADGTMSRHSAALTMSEFLATHWFFSATFTPAIAIPPVSMLTESFWSGGPLRMNEKAAKLLAKPCGDSDYQAHLAEKPRTLFHTDDYLREDVEASIAEYDLCYDLYVQFQNDPLAQPIEDGEAVWDEVLAPPIEVARVTVPAADPASLAAQQAYCGQLSFTPWHGLAAHQPLGSLNRARQKVYSASAFHRGYSGVEPDGAESF